MAAYSESNPHSSVHLRRYPFPYRAALAVSNDVDGMDWRSFEDWHAFVSGTELTPEGPGLGLEVADSFWLWSDTGAFALRHAPPWADPGRSSPESARIVELVKAGWLDSLHSFGDWRPEYHLTELNITRAFELLHDLGIKPPVYVNHGSGLRLHNLGGPWASYQSGDDPNSESYHLKALLDAGFRFFWTDIMFQQDVFGEELKLKTPSTLSTRERLRWLTVVDRSASSHERTRRNVLSGVDRNRMNLLAETLQNRVLVPALGRDDTPFLCFKRYRGREAPNSVTFAAQVSDEHLDALEAGEGACIVYQHFGVSRALGRGKGHVSVNDVRKRVLDKNAVWAFRELHQRQSDGRLFITMTGRLLQYLWVRQSLRYTVSTIGTTLNITITGLDCPTYGMRDAIDDDLQGITFVVEAASQYRDITVRNGTAVVEVRRERDPAQTDTDVVFVPWRRLEFPTLDTQPTRTLSTARLGPQPPKQNRSIEALPLTEDQSARFVSLVDAIADQSPTTVDRSTDLEKIAAEWESIPFPPLFGDAMTYAKKMHEIPYVDYLNRLRRLTAGGRSILDAGSGTATWSFPMATLFDRVTAVDKNRPRVDMARWLVKWARTKRVMAVYDDVADLNVAANSMDFVFCYGVAISYLSPRVILREFQRVARPGAEIYVCVNGIGWSYYLRDDRGATSATSRLQGQRGLYNTFCQTQQPDTNQRISELRARLAVEGSRATLAANAVGLSLPALLAWLVELNSAKRLAQAPETGCEGSPVPPTDPPQPGSPETAQAISDAVGEFALTPSSPIPLSARHLAAIVDALLETFDLAKTPMLSTLRDIEHECGEGFVDEFGDDLLNLLSGKRAVFSYANSGRGFAPDEIEEISEELGLVDFRWAGEGQLIGETGVDADVRPFFDSEFNGHLGVWEFIVRKR